MMKIVRKYKSESINPRVSKTNNGKKKKKRYYQKVEYVELIKID